MTKKKKQEPIIEQVNEEKFDSHLIARNVIADSNNITRDIYDKSRFGEPVEKNKFQYGMIEALFLLEKERINIYDGKKLMDFDVFMKKASKLDKTFWIKYCVYRDLRKRGYIAKTALKFGADFRVYDRGVKPGDDHAKWVVFPVHETDSFNWHEFSAKNRVAHSTRKNLLIGIVDEESDVTYYEITWTRP
ncbi:MAG: tRNA-intron lyase [Nanoarchaeota archaeon]|nr:tRNA-intron lyase [Nanoarchaeota archaeon]MBU0963327.1 tRNA-intron lyase [Nanoarchaeota archaeon]